MSKKNRPLKSIQVNQPQKPVYIPSNVSQQILGPAPKSIVSVETTHSSHSGPIPSPEVIGGYEKVLAGSADRIIKMAEREQGHRHQLQIRGQSQQAILTFVGQLFAFIMGFSGIAGGIYLVKSDKSIAGFSVFFTSLSVLVGAYLYNRKKSSLPKDKQ